MTPAQGASVPSPPAAGTPPAFVIYSPRYDDRWGGIIALHTLARVLGELGVPAYLRYFGRLATLRSMLQSLSRRRGPVRRDPLWQRVRGQFAPPPAGLRQAGWWLPEDPIVVYPEIVDGNPLKARRVVRWFLNKPGRMTGRVNFGANELYFFFDEGFNDPTINPDPENRLQVITVLRDVYRRWNDGPRHGTCYVLRKGRARAPDPSTLDGEVIDGLPHAQVADLFNRREYCVSYDLETLYTEYAALCGCKAVVIPKPGLSREDWKAQHRAIVATAYGFDDEERGTVDPGRVARQLDALEAGNIPEVRRFLERCRGHFPDAWQP